MGGHLITIDTPDEQQHLKRIAMRGWSFIGGERVDGTWRWVTGDAIQAVYWQRGQPENGEHDRYLVVNGRGEWGDSQADNKFYFICEWDGFGSERQ